MVEKISLLCNFYARTILWLCIEFDTFALIEVIFFHIFV
jgi:hypothetical protein